MRRLTGGVLLSGDWQGAWSNLHRLEVYLEWFLGEIKRLQPAAVVLTGDLKEALNPVDVRVATFVASAITRIKETAGHSPIVVCGNHDRVGMQDDSGDWLPLLENAGATAISEPRIVNRGTIRFHVVPYYGSTDTCRDAFRKISKGASPNLSVLLFHHTLNGARFDMRRTGSSSLRPVDLRPERYAACLGGHIHLPQDIAPNIRYVGSPFSMDWGEINCPRGAYYLEPDLKTGRRLVSPLPAWLDPDLPGFAEPAGGWANAYIRLRVPQDKELEVIRKAKALYPGAQFYVARPVNEKVALSEPTRVEGSDSQLLKAYLKANPVPEPGRYLAYLQHILSQVAAGQGTSGFDLLRLVGVNILSFRKVEIDYRKPGLCVVSGANLDRGGSNGSGKSNYLQLPLAALFGRTLKDQQNDELVCQKAKGRKSYLKLWVRLPDGRKCCIIRRRKPKPGLELRIEGENISTGFGRHDTQKRLEELLGISFDSAVNSMYIDQSEINTLLVGPDAQRRDLLSKLVGLSRFAAGVELVTKELRRVEVLLNQTLPPQLMALESRASSLKASLAEFRATATTLDTSGLPDLQQKLADLKRKVTKQMSREDNAKVAVSRQEEKLKKALYAEQELRYASDGLKGQLADLKKGRSCPTCGRPLEGQPRDPGPLRKKLEEVNAQRLEATKVRKALEISHEEAKAAWRNLSGRSVGTLLMIERLHSEIKHLENQAKALAGVNDRIERISQELREVDLLRTNAVQYQKDLQDDRTFLLRARDILNRKGLPAFLVATLCPRLNETTSYFSELFADGAINVVFTAKDGDLSVKIDNPQGGAKIKDQSCGELRLASLITSFSVRQVAARYNVLIADEPGHGLDDRSSIRFAKALEGVASRFGRLLITSHDPALLQALQATEQVHITKRNGVSTAQ